MSLFYNLLLSHTQSCDTFIHINCVFSLPPTRVTNVFYEQYLTIVPEGLFIISLCLLPTFVVCCLLLGLDLRSGLLNLLTIIMITVDTVGVMTLWGIDYNAVALINLVTVSTCRVPSLYISLQQHKAYHNEIHTGDVIELA